MFCENCGAMIKDGSRFCENCGEPVQAEAERAFQEECAASAADSTAEPADGLQADESKPTAASNAVTGEPNLAGAGEIEADGITAEEGMADEPDAAEEPEASGAAKGADGLHELEELMEMDTENDFLDFPDKTRVFVKPSKERSVSAKIGIDPEDEFFVEPKVGAVHRSLPVMDLWEEESDRTEEAESQKHAEMPKDDPAYEDTPDVFGDADVAFGERYTQEISDDRTPLEAEEDQEEEAAASAAGESASGFQTDADAASEDVSDGTDIPASEAADKEGNASFEHLDNRSEDMGTDDSEGYEPLFCMACGKPLPKGAAFCDACGTRTGAVSPAEIRSRRQSRQGLALGLLADFFVKPESTIERAADETASLSGVAFFLLKDVILAVLAAAFMKKITLSLGLFGSLLIGGDSFGFAAKVFLGAIVMDALWIGILFGAGYLFQTDCPIKILIGACGTASLLPTALLIVATLLIAFVPAIASEAIVVTMLVALIAMTKAAAAAFIPPQDRLLYMMAVATSAYAIVIVAAMDLMGAPLIG